MAAITPALITSLQTGFRKNFQDGQAKAEPMWSRVATEVPSTTAANTYGWLGQFPQMREWIGDRVIRDIKSHAYQIQNKSWESTVGVRREDIEDDTFGVYGPLFEEMGYAAATQVDLALWPLLKAGDVTTCYDGQYFFDTDHPVYPNHDGTGGAASVSNRTTGIGPKWWLMCTKRALKPMIVQMRRRPDFTAKTSQQQSDHVFISNTYVWGADMRFNAGFGLWQFAHQSQAELTAANLFAAFAAMEGITADGGRPLGIVPDLLVVPPSLRAAAMRALAERDDAGASNPAYKLVDVIVPSWLA